MCKYEGLREEEIKNKVARDWFSKYEHTQIIGNIDFCISPVAMKKDAYYLFSENEIQDNIPSMLWAEAKKGKVKDIKESFVQLILTIGKARTVDTHLPPSFLGAFDAEKIAFIPYHEISKIFSQNDFNWNVTPSDHSSKEFIQLYGMVKEILESNTLLFDFKENEKELKEFISSNFKIGIDTLAKIQVNKNNFVFVYQKWQTQVMPSINIDWSKLSRMGVIGADFFLADLLSSGNESIKENLLVVLQRNKYQINKEIDSFLGTPVTMQIKFKDGQTAHKQFWNLYERPPKEEYWNYIIERRDLLVPQDIRERKGSFFTPQIWVQKSQEYIASVLGENWQEEYVVWDCCAGTGNLLNGLTSKRNIWASTLDKADVNVMKDRVANGAQLFEDHIFQFDFLNDSFDKLPDGLKQIVNDPEKRKKLVVYINPPYAEASNARTAMGTGGNRGGISANFISEKYKSLLSKAMNELFAHFLIRISMELKNCIIANFSTLKSLQASNFNDFRHNFASSLLKLFIVPAYTFDNVKGKFPIGFFIWDTAKYKCFNETIAEVYNEKGDFFCKKTIFTPTKGNLIIDWYRKFYDCSEKALGYLRIIGTDIQNSKYVNIASEPSENDIKKHMFSIITKTNLNPSCIYYAVRFCIEPTWLNDRDQFLYPEDGWKDDNVFQLDCLVFTLFHGQNRISSEHGTNHWIPFTEDQVGSRKSFDSNFMSNYLKGKELSAEAKAVYDAGLLLWRYYFMKQNINPNASFYDIRKYFQGETNGRMNNDSNDETYSHYIADLRSKQIILAKKIEQKVYKYGFLK